MDFTQNIGVSQTLKVFREPFYSGVNLFRARMTVAIAGYILTLRTNRDATVVAPQMITFDDSWGLFLAIRTLHLYQSTLFSS